MSASHRPLLVLGMHRSGTSSLTGCLEQAGLYLGDVSRKNPYNLKGNNENLAVMRLNDAVLADNGAAWDAPPTGSLRWSAERRAERDRILAQYGTARRFGIKDPRMLLTLEGWLEVLPEVSFAATFRHPKSVAQSLHARGGFPMQRARELWLIYNRRLLDFSARRNVPLICFDWPSDVYTAALETLCYRLNLTPPREGFDFFEAGLRHNAAPPELPSNPELAVYQALLDRAVMHPSPGRI